MVHTAQYTRNNIFFARISLVKMKKADNYEFV